MEKVRLCLLGAGRWGKRYIETIGTLEDAELSALAARTPEGLAKAPEGCRTFGDWRHAVEAPEVDGVIIATPPSLHAEMALFSLARARPVLIEKPLALDLERADHVLLAFDEAQVLAMVGHTQMYNPGFDALCRALPLIGDIRSVRCVAGGSGPYRSDVTPLWDWSPHDVAMCLSLMGHSPVAVTAICLAAEKIGGGWAGDYRLQLDFEGGVTADIHVSNMMERKQRVISVEGAQGELVLDDVASSLTLHQAGTETAVPFAPERPLARQVRTFVEAIRMGVRSNPSLRLGRDVVAVLSQCQAQLHPDCLE